MSKQPKIQRFKENVEAKYKIYNSIFMTLPFDSITKTGVLLPLFHETCQKGYERGDDPTTIVKSFFNKYQARRDQKSQINLLFRFIQYIERQVVLFDAIEDAAFPIINNMDGIGTLRNLKEYASKNNKLDDLKKYLNDFKVRIVLTAHPTQFYPDSVLGIINDLSKSIKINDIQQITQLLAQLGKTPFFRQKKPTPYDEAISLIWYLENVFYKSFGDIYDYVKENIFDNDKNLNNEIINIGFWPGGDRDGNPYVTPETTLKVAKKLKEAIIKSYHRDIKLLKRKLTFVGVEDKILSLEQQLYNTLINPKNNSLTLKYIKGELTEIKEVLKTQHQSLYLKEIESLINKIQLFGFHFANLDIRQDSRQHHNVFNTIIKKLKENNIDIFPNNYEKLSSSEQILILSKVEGKIDLSIFKDEFVIRTLETIKAIKTIQEINGEKAANRYIISNNQTSLNVMQLYAMLKLVAFHEKLTVDIVPLFETISDLENASSVMEELYTNKSYINHLKERNSKQTIMLGFSDGTKDGGYLMANWAIFKAKEELTKISRKYGVTIIFFDGRGGPPARGGGKTHQFYASLAPNIEDKEIQLTIQGQTISSNFGTLESSQYNVEQLISSGITNKLNDKLLTNDLKTINELAKISYHTYSNFKKHPKFLAYLEKMSTLKYYAKTNIGSRPSKRSNSDKLIFSDLRAIPFVGSWSQLKQNVPGFFGVGTALKHYEDNNEFGKIIALYNQSSFFKTLIENSMMSLSKSFFELTKYMRNNKEYGEFWGIIYEEYQLSYRLILKLTGHSQLMENQPSVKASIDIRESIVRPLLTIQQYALKEIQELEKNKSANQNQIETFEKIVVRSLYGNINASRNSA